MWICDAYEDQNSICSPWCNKKLNPSSPLQQDGDNTDHQLTAKNCLPNSKAKKIHYLHQQDLQQHICPQAKPIRPSTCIYLLEKSCNKKWTFHIFKRCSEFYWFFSNAGIPSVSTDIYQLPTTQKESKKNTAYLLAHLRSPNLK